LRSSTPPFLPLRALPSASAFSWRRAERRAAISLAVGLPPGAAVLIGAVCGAAPALPVALTDFATGCGTAFARALGAFWVAGFGVAGFGFSRRRAAVAAGTFA